MDIEMPENFPYEKPPEKGDTMQFLVDAKLKDGRTWEITTIDGVPMSTPGKASAPGDDGSADVPADEAESAEPPDSSASGDEELEPKPSGGMDTPAPRSVGQAFSSKVMGG